MNEILALRIKTLESALAQIAELAPKSEPRDQVNHDLESAYNQGVDMAAWERSVIAQKALKLAGSVVGQFAQGEVAFWVLRTSQAGGVSDVSGYWTKEAGVEAAMKSLQGLSEEALSVRRKQLTEEGWCYGADQADYVHLDRVVPRGEGPTESAAQVLWSRKVLYIEAYSETDSQAPEFAKLTLSRALLEKVLAMKDIMEIASLSEVRTMWSADMWGPEEDGDRINMDLEELVVSCGSFHLVGFVKHDDVPVRTRPVSITELECIAANQEQFEWFLSPSDPATLEEMVRDHTGAVEEGSDEALGN